MTTRRLICQSCISLLVLVVPVSDNYSLSELDFGSGGGVGQSNQYQMEGLTSEQGNPMSGSTYNGGLGLGFTQMAAVPPAPTFTNPDNYYNQLHLILDPSDNPSDTLFAIAISSDNFVTTHYVKADQAIGDTLTLNDYQTYNDWGDSAGFNILGLDPGTSYQVKVKAFQGDFTESPFGPSASASTVNPSLTFDIDIASSDTSTDPPHQLSLGVLLANTITTATNKIWLSLSSNAQSGSNIYLAGQNGALTSAQANYSIDSANADLAAVSQGFGVRGDSIDQASGGPFNYEAAYALSDDNVAVIPTTYTKLASSSTPLTDGRASLVVKAKPSDSAPAASDYQEVLTIIAAASF